MRFCNFVLIMLFVLVGKAEVATPKKLKPKPIPGFSSGLVAFELTLHTDAGEKLSLRAVDPISKSAAQLVMDRSAVEPGLYRGVFDIQLANAKVELARIEYFDLKGRKFFSKHVTNSDQNLVVLFETEKELKEFEAQPVEMVNLRLEALAALEREAQLEELNKLGEKEKKERLAKAKQIGELGLQAFRAGQFPQAVGYFSEAAKADPSNESYIYQHGVSLYRVKQYNKSLALLSIADSPEVNQIEKRYYISLNNMKLKNTDKALKGFAEVKEAKDPYLSAMASFYAGHMEYQAQHFVAARKNFEDVVDLSKDPKLDKEAEKMLDEIDRQETIAAANRLIFAYSFFFGPVYDSNVLNIASSDSATDLKALRANYGASLKANILRGKNYEWNGELGLNDYYSTKTNFSADATLQAADALEVNLGLPLRVSSFDIKPSYNSIYLAPSGGTRTLAISTVAVDLAHTAMLAPSWILVSKLVGAQDTSKLEITSSDDDQTGTRYSLGFSFVKLFDLKGESALTTEVTYAKNQTKGINYRSSKPGASLTYVFPGFWKNTAMTRLEYSQQAFSEATTTRTDSVISMLVTQNKKLTHNWDFSFGLQVTNSSSGVSAYKYDKYMISTLFTYSGSIVKDPPKQ